MASSMNIKWCKKNLEKFSQSVYDVLKEEYPDVDMSVEDCLDVCSLCTDVPFAIRNNATVAARDARGLYIKLKKGMGFMEKEVLPGTYAAAAQAAGQTTEQAQNEETVQK